MRSVALNTEKGSDYEKSVHQQNHARGVHGPLFCVAGWSYTFINDRVQVEWKGGWYPARVLKVEGDKYLIHYDGYQAAYDEWVTAARMKALSVPSTRSAIR